VLERWTRASTRSLPDASRLLFAVLCCVEPGDRFEPVVSDNWVDIWRRLQRPGEPPSAESALAPISEHALVDVERDSDCNARAYHLHPAVAASGRADAEADVQTAVDVELAAYWTTIREEARRREAEQLGGLMLRAARSAVPYLVRQHLWQQLIWTAGDVVVRDESVSTAASLLPLLRQAASAADGSEYGLSIHRVCARAAEILHPADAATQYRDLLAQADAEQDFELAGIIAGDLIRVTRTAGRLHEALDLTEAMLDYDRRAGLGPWTLLADEAQRLQILALMGHSQQVLDEVNTLRARMAELPETSEHRETGDPFNVREIILDTGREAARDLKQWEDALALNAERLEWKKLRDAPDLDLAGSAFNDYFPLLRLGRVDEARRLLLRCREVFERERAIGMLGVTLSALADVEDELGRPDQALRFEANALRLMYSVGGADGIRASHFNLGIYLKRHGGDQREALAHRLAAAIIDYQTNSGRLPESLNVIARDTGGAGSSALSWDEVCELTGRTEGVQLAELAAQLPTRAADGPAALAEVLRLAAELPPEQVFNVERHVANWDPVLSALVAAKGGDPDAADLLERVLAAREQQRDWTVLTGVLRRLAAGEHDADLLAGLDPIDSAIAQRAMDALDGQVAIEADAWRALVAAPGGDESPLADALVTLAALVVIASRGDEAAKADLQPVLAEMAEQEQWAALAGVLPRIVAGERDPTLADGLDETDTAVVTHILTLLAAPGDP
jgi:hypothetical protein